jgi:cob(I)alamin adenosyltransferase
MVLLSKIYTKSGDKGKTSLGDGKRIDKSSLRIQAIGTVDESNSVLGLVRAKKNPTLSDLLRHIQNDLFDLGADLCIPQEQEGKLTITENQVIFLEQQIDHYNALLTPLNSFVLPGGSMLSSKLHFARTVVRRAERDVCALALEDQVNPQVITYLNRLSDLLFVLARVENDQGKSDVLWVPGASRSQKYPKEKNSG